LQFWFCRKFGVRVVVVGMSVLNNGVKYKVLTHEYDKRNI